METEGIGLWAGIWSCVKEGWGLAHLGNLPSSPHPPAPTCGSSDKRHRRSRVALGRRLFLGDTCPPPRLRRRP